MILQNKKNELYFKVNLMFLKSWLVKFWRFWKKKTLKKRGVVLKRNVIFNSSTDFAGENIIHEGAYISDTKIGRHSYVGRNCCLNNCEIGSYCSIASNVSFVSGNHPTCVFVSTSPVFNSVKGQAGKPFVVENKWNDTRSINGRNVIIGNDVWIAKNVTIVGGTKIGDGAIIALGAVVTKDVPPYAIVGGVPAKLIRYRFPDNQIFVLRKDKWWEKNDEWLKEHAELFTNIENYINFLSNDN